MIHSRTNIIGPAYQGALTHSRAVWENLRCIMNALYMHGGGEAKFATSDPGKNLDNLEHTWKFVPHPFLRMWGTS